MKIEYTGDNSPTIKFPTDLKPKTWENVPEGNHSAKLHSFSQCETKSGISGYKLTWLIEAPDAPADYLVANNYMGKGLELLWSGMRAWLGDGLFEYYLDADGSLYPKQLIGLEADICVKHVKTEGLEKPLSRATKFAQPGTLVKRRINPASPEETLYQGNSGLN